MTDVTPVRNSPRRVVIVIVLVAIALGVLVFRGLGSATVYFRTVDQAIEQRQSLRDKRFRLEGIVAAKSVKSTNDRVEFAVEGERGKISVIHTGNEPDLFRPGIPVVLEGQFAGDIFVSNQMMIKHSETYAEKNPDRVADYQQGKTK